MAPERVWLNDADGTGSETLEITCAEDARTLLHFERQDLLR